MFQACCSVITILRISSQHCFIVIGSGCSISLSVSVLLIWLFFLCAADPNEPSEGSEVTRVYFLCSRTAEEMVNYTTLSFYIEMYASVVFLYWVPGFVVQLQLRVGKTQT